MILSIFFRLLRLVITSVLCSLPIYLGYMGTINDSGILFISFIAFIIATGVDAYKFSFSFWELRDYWIGQIIPLAIYVIMGFLTCLLFSPVVFNRIFLPLRFADAFGMTTSESIAIMAVTILIIVSVLRFFGARTGYFVYRINSVSDEDE